MSGLLLTTILGLLFHTLKGRGVNVATFKFLHTSMFPSRSREGHGRSESILYRTFNHTFFASIVRVPRVYPATKDNIL